MKRFYKIPFRAFFLILVLSTVSTASYSQAFDPTFTSPLILRQGVTTIMKTAANNKVYVAGDLDYHGELKVRKVVRLTPGGFLDTSFQPELPAWNGNVNDMEVLPNGNLVISYRDPIVGGTSLLVLASDGRLLKQFDEMHSVSCLRALPDNSFLVGTSDGFVSRFTKGLNLDTDFNIATTGDPIYDIQLQGSKILLSGNFTSIFDFSTGGSYDRKYIARFYMDGSIDLSFDANAETVKYGEVPGMYIQSDGKIILLNRNRFAQTGKIPVRLNVNGSRDNSFQYAGLTIQDAAVYQGKITISTRSRIARLNIDGTVDPTFNPIVYDPADVRLLVFPDNSLLAANYAKLLYGIGKFNSQGGPVDYKAALMRNGIVNTMDRTTASIFIGGEFMKVGNHFTKNLARLNLNGTVLTKFKANNINEEVLNIKGFSNAKVVAQTSTDIYRMEHDGRIDPSFSFTPFDGLTTISKMIVQNDGKILIGAPSKIFRLNNNGSKDNSFSAAVGALGNSAEAYYFDFDLDRTSGKIIFTGIFPSGPFPQTRNMWRLNTNGSVDDSFSKQGAGELIVRIIFLDNLQVMVSGGKLNADGTWNQEFRTNYDESNQSMNYFEFLHRFRGHVIMSTNYFYSQTAVSQFITEDGFVSDELSFPASMTTYWLNNYYSDNNDELFVLGQISSSPSSHPLQIVKLIYSDDEPLSTRAKNNSSDQDVQVAFYPNPVKDFMTITVPGDATVSIYDLSGQRRLNTKVSTGNNLIDLKDVPRGRYVVHVISNGKFSKHHLIKE